MGNQQSVLLSRVGAWCVGLAMLVAIAIGCANPAKSSKTLPELVQFLNENGIPGTFSLVDPNAPLVVGGVEVKRAPIVREGQLAEGQFSDAVDGKIKSTFCILILFDSEDAAKKSVIDPKTDFVNGCFLIKLSGVEWQNKNVPYVFSQFKPYK